MSVSIDPERSWWRTAVMVPGLLLLTAAVGCANLSPDEVQEARRALDELGATTIGVFLQRHPELRERFDELPGYAVADMKVTKIPGVGAGGGAGVVVDRRSDTRTYVKVTRFEVGAGLGAQAFKAVVLFDDPELLDRAMTGFWHMEGSGEAAAGEKAAEGRVATSQGYQVFKISEGGAAVTATVRLVRARPFLE